MLCCKTEMRNWSYYRNSILEKRIPHHYCRKCGNHYHIDRWYTKEEWFFYVNEFVFLNNQAQDQVHQHLMETSPHAHEMVNHSNQKE